MSKTSMLYATPGFLSGLSTVLDLGSTLTVYNESDSAELADHRAILSDWIVVGEDIAYALKKWEDMYVKK